MPDILILGLSIPKEGFINLSVQSEGLTMLTATSTFNEKTGSYVWQKCDHVMYETVELPEHGDLILKDDAIVAVKLLSDLYPEYRKILAVLWDQIKDLTVIIPESEEATNDPKT